MVIPNEGEVRLLTNALKLSSLGSNGMTLRLYSNSVTVDKTVTSASFTEVVGGGYAAIALFRLAWVIAGITTISYPEVIFTFTASRTVNGFYITDDVSGDVILAKDAGTITVISGETLTLSLVLNLE